MTVQELIVQLQEISDILGKDCEVYLMVDKGWPMQLSIAGTIDLQSVRSASGSSMASESDDSQPNKAFILGGVKVGYGCKEAWGLVQQ